MIYPYPLFLHLLLAFICSFILIYIYKSKKFAEIKSINYYRQWFFCYFAYSVFLSIPLFFFDSLSIGLFYFYALALLSLALGMWFIFNMGLDFWNFDWKVKKVLSYLYLSGALMASLLHFIFPEVPRPSEDGKWIFWYSNKTISYFYTSFCFIVGYFWAISFIRNIKYLKIFALKLRAALLALAGFILPFSALFYFYPRKVLDIYLAFGFLIAGFILFLINTFIKPQKKI
jgi:hypothetical protein